MAQIDQIEHLIRPVVRPYVAGRFVVVPTFMSYENGAGVQVYVEGGGPSFVVSDGGGALKTYVDAGGEGAPAQKSLAYSASSAGLKFAEDGWIHSGRIPEAALSSVIAMVAECSFVASVALAKLLRRQRASKDFKELVGAALLSHGFHDLVRKKKFAGASQKEHAFDFGFEPRDGQWIVVDAVNPDPSSINSAIVANLDLRQTGRTDITQRIVYDDEGRWPQSDLALLSVGAPAIPYSTLRHSAVALRSLGLH